MQAVVQDFQTNAASGADRFGHRPRAAQRQRQTLDGVRDAHGVGYRFARQHFVQQRDFHRVQPGLPAHMFAEAAFAARFLQIAAQAFRVATRRQIQPQRRSAVAEDAVAQIGRDRIDHAAFDAGRGDHAFALQRVHRAVGILPVRDHRFQRCAGVFVGEMRAPADVETAVRRAQRCDIDTAFAQRRHPGAVRAQLRPARAAEREHARLRADAALAVGRIEAQPVVVVPAQPAMVHVETHAAFAQPAHPAAQQRRGLAIHREHPAGAADVGVDAVLKRPRAQRFAVESVEPTRNLPRALAVARIETRSRLAVGQVQTALAGDQEFASHRALRLEQIHRQPGRVRDLGRHQPGGAAADNGDLRGGGNGMRHR